MPRRAILSCLLASLVVPCAAGTIYTFHQATYGKQTYFFDDGWDGAFIERRFIGTGVFRDGVEKEEERIASNIMVRASTNADDPGIVEAVPGLRAWIDTKGHIHSIAALEQQQQFNHWLTDRRPDCAASGCTLTARRPAPFTVSTVAVTGITDAPALSLRHWELEVRYDAAASLLEDYCRALGDTACGQTGDANPIAVRWSDGLARTRPILDAYAVLLSSIALEAPRSPRKRYSHWHGLDNLLVPGESSQWSYFEHHKRFFVAPRPDEPENSVELAADFKSFAALHLELEAARRKAAAELREVEYLADAATEIPEERSK